MRSVYAVLPGDIDDPATPSGGNSYDRRVLDGLAAAGWSVHELAMPGAWPAPSTAERAGLAAALDALPDGALVLLDGLVAAAVPDVLVPAAQRLRPVVLVHMPLDREPERQALAAARAIVTTTGTGWLRSGYTWRGPGSTRPGPRPAHRPVPH
jgi:hypothetical protein